MAHLLEVGFVNNCSRNSFLKLLDIVFKRIDEWDIRLSVFLFWATAKTGVRFSADQQVAWEQRAVLDLPWVSAYYASIIIHAHSIGKDQQPPSTTMVASLQQELPRILLDGDSLAVSRALFGAAKQRWQLNAPLLKAASTAAKRALPQMDGQDAVITLWACGPLKLQLEPPVLEALIVISADDLANRWDTGGAMLFLAALDTQVSYLSACTAVPCQTHTLNPANACRRSM